MNKRCQLDWQKTEERRRQSQTRKQRQKDPERWARTCPLRRTILLGEAGRLQEGHLPVTVQVLLVSTQDDDDVLAGQHSGVSQPVGQGVISLPAEGKGMRTSGTYGGWDLDAGLSPASNKLAFLQKSHVLMAASRRLPR